MHAQSVLQIYSCVYVVLIEHTCTTQNVRFTLCAYFTLSDLSCILKSKQFGAILHFPLKNTGIG